MTLKGLLFIVICAISNTTLAQSTSNLSPDNETTQDTSQQKDMHDILTKWFNLHPKERKQYHENKVYFTLNPLANTPTSSGNAFVTSASAIAYLGPKATTNLSTFNFSPYYNFNNRYGLPLRSTIWLRDNSWVIHGDFRFLVYPQYTWGLGTSHTDQEKELVNYEYVRLYQAGLKRIKTHMYVGLGYDLDYHFDIHGDSGVDLQKFTGYDHGLSGNSVSSGLTLNFLYDTRNRNVYPFPGSFLLFVYRANPVFLGNSNFWQSIFVDIRKYLPLNRERPTQQNILTFWSFLWWNLNGNTPYLDLPSTGWDEYNRSARGFDQNRYRGQSLYYFETEYRRDITKNGLLGFVLFSNINTVSGSGTMFQDWHPAGGLGLRVKLSKYSHTNFAIDYAFSKGYETVLFNLNETF